LTKEDIDRIIEMAWEDRTPFDAIEYQFGIKENDVRKLMRKYMKKSSFIMWRKRVKSRKTKHKTNNLSTRFKSKIVHRDKSLIKKPETLEEVIEELRDRFEFVEDKSILEKAIKDIKKSWNKINK
jgi:uncharacterized protein (TIGR03643 family)